MKSFKHIHYQIFCLLCCLLANIFSSTVFAKENKTRKSSSRERKELPIKSEENDGIVRTSFVNQNIDIGVLAKQVYMMDDETKTVLIEKNSDVLMQPASMTKIMTSLMVFEKLKSGHLKEDQLFTVSHRGYQTEGSSMFLQINSQVSVMDLLKGLIIQSGNDASIVLAENLAGSESFFAQEMTNRAKTIGATQTSFKNANGLPDPGHLTTAKDLAIISSYMIRHFPTYYKIYGEKTFTYNKITQGNRNPLLYKNISCDGIKTGYTNESGYGMVASCKQGDRRLILVINGLKSMQSRADEAFKLMTWGFQAFTNKKVYEAKTAIFDPVPVLYGKKSKVSPFIKEDIVLTVPKMHEDKIISEVVLKKEIEAPIKKGDILGYIEVRCPALPSVLRYNVYALFDVERSNFLQYLGEYMSRKAQNFFKR